MPRLAHDLLALLLLASPAPAQPTLASRDLDAVLQLLQGAGLHEVQLRRVLAQEGTPGLFELARKRAAALAARPAALAGGQLVLARQALAYFRLTSPAKPEPPPAPPPSPAPAPSRSPGGASRPP